MAELARLTEILKKVAGSLLDDLEHNTVKHASCSGEDISEISRAIVKAVLVFFSPTLPENTDIGKLSSVDDSGEFGAALKAGRELAEKLRGSGSGMGDFFESHRQVKNYLLDSIWRSWSEVDDLRGFFPLLDRFLGDVANAFATEWMRMDRVVFRRRHQEAKRFILQEKKRYATVFYRMQEPAFVVDQGLCLIDVNPAFEKFFGISSVELDGLTCCELIGNEFCKDCFLDEMIKTGGSFSNHEITVPMLPSDGKGRGGMRNILVAGAALGDIDSENRGGIVIIQDISEQRKVSHELEEYRLWLEDLVDERTEELIAANQRLQNEIYEKSQIEKELIEATALLKRSNAELEHFAHVVSHDLQEPLMLVSSFAERLILRYATVLDERGRGYLERIVKATRKLQDLVDALLQLSRVSSSAGNFEMLDLNDLVRDVVSDLEEMVKRHGARFEIGDLHGVCGDVIQIRQLFQNIISNALKYRREDNPRISISSRIVDGFCEIFVEDNGIGFEESDLKKIFEPFVRLHGRGAYSGSGMGLTTCKKIVERHGGEISARCKPESGAVFVIRLPLREAKSGQ